jgi:hypothetical protein
MHASRLLLKQVRPKLLERAAYDEGYALSDDFTAKI